MPLPLEQKTGGTVYYYSGFVFLEADVWLGIDLPGIP